MCIFLFEKCRNVFSSCHQLQQAPGRLDPGAFHLLPSPARKFSQKTLTNPCPSGNIYRQSVRLRIEYGRVPEWPMGTDCKSAAFSFGGSNPPAPTKKTSVENTLVFCFIRYLKFHSQGWIRTAAEPTAACGGNREARLSRVPIKQYLQKFPKWGRFGVTSVTPFLLLPVHPEGYTPAHHT